MVIKFLILSLLFVTLMSTAFYARQIARKFLAASMDKLTISFHNAEVLIKLFNIIAFGLACLALALLYLTIIFVPHVNLSGPIWIFVDIGTSFSIAQAWAFREAYNRFYVTGSY